MNVVNIDLSPQILSEIENMYGQVVAWRRDFHRHPEIGFDVHRTAGIVAQEMEKLGLKVRTGVGQTGVLADFVVDTQAPMIAIRADMDALPMEEEGTPEYRSTIPGRAHMCGHDAHTAMLMGAASIVSKFKTQARLNVRFLFQPSEEAYPGGASAMIADGALDGVSRIYGQHVWPRLPVGQIAVGIGPIFAQPDNFTITIEGLGGHAAVPQETRDPIVIGAQVVQFLQTIISRSVSPLEAAVISVTQFHAGTAMNVIPQVAQLKGTIRSFNPQVLSRILERITTGLQGLAMASGCQIKWDYREGYPVTVNNPELSNIQQQRLSGIAEKVISPYEPSMGGEDFAYYGQKIPACFWLLGTGNEQRPNTLRMCHDPRFDIDESAMKLGLKALVFSAFNG